MSVFTSLEKPIIQTFLDQMGLGALLRYEGAAHGIENSNYFITTQEANNQRGHFVLTLFEQLSAAEIPFYIELLESLQKAGLPVPAALHDQRGHTLFTLAEKPCILVPRFKGHHVEQSNVQQCQQIGQTLARIHLATRPLTTTKINDRGLDWMHSMQAPLSPFLSAAENAMLTEELLFYQQEIPKLNLPQGIIHSDLFRDNALFENDQLSGVIDFYNACTDFFLYDLAVTVNDWCIEADGTLATQRLKALISAYHLERPLSRQEQQAWPMLIRLAATRFWLSRLESWHLENPNLEAISSGTKKADRKEQNVGKDKIQIITVKNPREFELILIDRIDHAVSIEDFLWLPNLLKTETYKVTASP